MLLLDKHTIIEQTRTRTIYNWLKCFSPELLHSEISEAGFQIKAFFSDVAGTAFRPGTKQFAIVATKP